MSDNESFSSETAPQPVGAYPHAKRVGNLLFLSGIGPRSSSDNSVPGVVVGENDEVLHYDIEAQCHAVFANVLKVLQSAGAEWADIVDITVFLTNIRQDFGTFNRIYADYFTPDGPTRTTVEVNRLPTPIAIELKCLAVVNSESTGH